MPLHVRRNPERPTRRPLRHATLASSLSLCLVLPAFAGNLTGGASHTVAATDAKEDWRVDQASRLTLAPGASAGAISLLQQSTLTSTDATLSGAVGGPLVQLVDSTATLTRTTVKNTSGIGLSLGSDIGMSTLPISMLTLATGSVEGVGTAVRISGKGDLTASNATLIATLDGSRPASASNGAALHIGHGDARFDQSTLRGDLHGVLIESTQAATTADPYSRFLAYNTRIEGKAGSAIMIGLSSDLPRSNLTLRQVELVAGNGILIDVQSRTPSSTADLSSSITLGNSRLTGDIRFAAGTKGSLLFLDSAQLLGDVSGQVTMHMELGSRWKMTRSASISNLSISGLAGVTLGDGSSFHTLDVAGDFNGGTSSRGSSGTMEFNTVLAGDASATDRLIIGGSTTGNANVRVNNVGGGGAQTSKGIELITVKGTSDATFKLIERVVAGQYEYFLHKGGGTDGNWYLRSQLPAQPDPCELDPSLPECNPRPVLRPEAGAYLANLQAAQSLFRTGYHDRHAGQNGGRAWVRANGSRQGFDAISRQLDIRGNSQSLTVGADLWQADGGSVGISLSTGNATSTSTNELSGYYARGKVKGEALGAYGSWRENNDADPYAGFYVDGSLQRAHFRNRVEGIGLATERYEMRAWQGAVETGYAFRLAGTSNGSVYLEPSLQVGYNRWDSERHTEANGTVVSAPEANGLFGHAGLRLSGVTRWGGGAAEVQPYVSANWLHNGARSQIQMGDELADARIPRNRGEFNAGASMKFANGVGAWGGVSLQKASGFHQTSAQVGLNYRW